MQRGGPLPRPCERAKSFLLLQMLGILFARRLSKPARGRSAFWRTRKGSHRMGKSGGGGVENGVIGTMGQRPRPRSRGSRARAPAAPGRGPPGEPGASIHPQDLAGHEHRLRATLCCQGDLLARRRSGRSKRWGRPGSGISTLHPRISAPRHAFSLAFLSGSAAPSSLRGWQTVRRGVGGKEGILLQEKGRS